MQSLYELVDSQVVAFGFQINGAVGLIADKAVYAKIVGLLASPVTKVDALDLAMDADIQVFHKFSLWKVEENGRRGICLQFVTVGA